MKTRLLLCSFVAILVFSPLSYGQDQPEKADRPKNAWYAPDYVVMQHAGLIGILAAGVGYDFGRHDRTNAELMYGFTPNYGFKNTTHTFTTRIYYQSHPKPLYRDYKISWLKTGLGISMTIGEQFETFFPQHYPEGYYIWPTATRLLPFIGSSVGREFKGKNRPLFGEFYGEIGTADVLVVDKIRNKGISVPDILNLALGVRLKL